jgi:hypothetical protein
VVRHSFQRAVCVSALSKVGGGGGLEVEELEIDLTGNLEWVP